MERDGRDQRWSRRGSGSCQVFRVDDMGRDVVVGYGSVLVPTQAGRHERMVHMYAPQPSSLLQRFRAWISGAYPEVGERERARQAYEVCLMKVFLGFIFDGSRFVMPRLE